MKQPMLEGSPAEEASESPEYEKHELDRHMNTMIDAEKIKGDAKLMKHLAPHMEKHKAAVHKITSLTDLRAVAKKKIAEPD